MATLYAMLTLNNVSFDSRAASFAVSFVSPSPVFQAVCAAPRFHATTSLSFHDRQRALTSAAALCMQISHRSRRRSASCPRPVRSPYISDLGCTVRRTLTGTAPCTGRAPSLYLATHPAGARPTVKLSYARIVNFAAVCAFLPRPSRGLFS